MPPDSIIWFAMAGNPAHMNENVSDEDIAPGIESQAVKPALLTCKVPAFAYTRPLFQTPRVLNEESFISTLNSSPPPMFVSIPRLCVALSSTSTNTLR